MEEYYNCQWVQEDVKTSYNLLIIIIIIIVVVVVVVVVVVIHGNYTHSQILDLSSCYADDKAVNKMGCLDLCSSGILCSVD
jgi:flagellar basal body-associated protein FliL